MMGIERRFLERYVERMRLEGSFLTPAVEQAFATVPLHELLPDLPMTHASARQTESRYERHLRHLYSGAPIFYPSKGAGGCSPLVPSMLAFLMERLRVESGMSVLQLEAGTGYEAALLSEILGSQSSVSTVDMSKDTAERCQAMLTFAGYPQLDVAASDPFYGNLARAPFDRILVTVGCPDISPHWVNQLKPKGSLLVPVDFGGWYPILRVWNTSQGIRARAIGSAGTMVAGIRGELELDEAPSRVGRVNDLRSSPLWADLRESEIQEFWFYACLRDERATVLDLVNGEEIVSRGFGLRESDWLWGAILSKPPRLLGESRLVSEIERLFREWRDLGRPRLADHVIEFVPRAEEDAQSRSALWRRRPNRLYDQRISVGA